MSKCEACGQEIRENPHTHEMVETPKIKSPFKSKTIQFNVLIPALWGIVEAFGIEVPGEVVVGTLALVNFVLRFFTKEPIK